MNLEEEEGSDESESSDDTSTSEDEEEDPIGGSRLIVCELYYGGMHGSKSNDGAFLVYSIYPGDQTGTKRALKDARMIRRENREYTGVLNHSTIRNYDALLKSGAFVNPQIAKCMYLPSGELVAVLKTCYLKIFQRIWKRYYKQKMAELETRKSIHYILKSRLYRS
jgi:hypothetical protein